MRIYSKVIKSVAVVGVLALFVGTFSVNTNAGNEETASGFDLAVGENGSIHLPDIDFRKEWTALGTWAIAAEEGMQGSKSFHTVYTQPESVTEFRKTGRFPDGTIMIKELYSAVTEDMTTGTVSRVDKTTGWFVMIKDSKGRFEGNKLWGDGWGWAQFDAADRVNTISADYQDDCKGCHIPAENTDWLYIQGYPVLQK